MLQMHTESSREGLGYSNLGLQSSSVPSFIWLLSSTPSAVVIQLNLPCDIDQESSNQFCQFYIPHPTPYTSYRGTSWLHGLQEPWDKAEDVLILAVTISTKEGNTFRPLSLQASRSLVSKSRKQKVVATAPSAPMTS